VYGRRAGQTCDTMFHNSSVVSSRPACVKILRQQSRVFLLWASSNCAHHYLKILGRHDVVSIPETHCSHTFSIAVMIFNGRDNTSGCSPSHSITQAPLNGVEQCMELTFVAKNYIIDEKHLQHTRDYSRHRKQYTAKLFSNLAPGFSERIMHIHTNKQAHARAEHQHGIPSGYYFHKLSP
jgi:hypothetical protein